MVFNSSVFFFANVAIVISELERSSRIIGDYIYANSPICMYTPFTKVINVRVSLCELSFGLLYLSFAFFLPFARIPIYLVELARNFVSRLIARHVLKLITRATRNNFPE